MTTLQVISRIKELVEPNAETKTAPEYAEAAGQEFIPHEWLGNSQDCYDSGVEDGMTELAREVLYLIEQLEDDTNTTG